MTIHEIQAPQLDVGKWLVGALVGEVGERYGRCPYGVFVLDAKDNYKMVCHAAFADEKSALEYARTAFLAQVDAAIDHLELQKSLAASNMMPERSE